MHGSGNIIPIFNKVITISRDTIAIKYDGKHLNFNFCDVYDIVLTKHRLKQNTLFLNFLAIILTLSPIIFYKKLENTIFMFSYVTCLLLFLYFKSERYKLAYYLKIITCDGKRIRIRIKSKDKLDVIREITFYIDYRFKRSMQNLFVEYTEVKTKFDSNAS